MSTIKTYFEQAQLSQAAYAKHLLPNMFGENDINYLTALEHGGVSSTQAIVFSNIYTVIDQYTDPDSGFSGVRGTVYQPLSIFHFLLRFIYGQNRPHYSSRISPPCHLKRQPPSGRLLL